MFISTQRCADHTGCTELNITYSMKSTRLGSDKFMISAHRKLTRSNQCQSSGSIKISTHESYPSRIHHRWVNPGFMCRLLIILDHLGSPGGPSGESQRASVISAYTNTNS